ncbi:MAG: tetratricopeptide repeat protein [Elusimicrobiota bacterium]|jgi:tetratricopeptide (TPR) repeat protein
MAKGWARQEAKRNEVAEVLERSSLWLRMHQQTAVWVGVGTAAALIVAATAVYRHFSAREDSWAKYAVAQSYAYSGQIPQAMELVKRLQEEHPGELAAGHARLLEGDIEFQQGRFKEAGETYQALLETARDKALIALAMADVGMTKEAAGDCRSAVDADQRFLDSYQDHFLAPQVHASMARCHLSLGEADKARAAYERIAFLYPDSSWAEWAKARLAPTKG